MVAVIYLWLYISLKNYYKYANWFGFVFRILWFEKHRGFVPFLSSNASATRYYLIICQELFCDSAVVVSVMDIISFLIHLIFFVSLMFNNWSFRLVSIVHLLAIHLWIYQITLSFEWFMNCDHVKIFLKFCAGLSVY